MEANQRKRVKCERLSMRAEARLVDALRAHQRRMQEQGLRVSLSEVACQLLRQGLDQGSAAQT